MENEKPSVRIFNAFKLAEDQNDVPEPKPKPEPEPEQEEEKMEKFFALIKSFNDARNRRRNELMIINEMEKKKNKRKRAESSEDDLQQSSWVPSFKREDFTEEIEFRRPPLIFPDPCNNRQVQKDQQDNQKDCLDLNLTL